MRTETLKASRGAEFAALYLVAPVAFALVLPPAWIWLALLVLTIVSVVLLARTPGFRWRSLLQRGAGRHLPFTILVVAATGLTGVLLASALHPEALFWLPRNQPGLWVVILVAYPVLSVLPQELAYRALFFARYGVLFPDRVAAAAANGFCFALAHLFLWNGPALLLSAAGGVVFAVAYRDRGSFPLACLLHMLAGQILFTTGAGAFFYHGLAG